jgi:hypothetical protein
MRSRQGSILELCAPGLDIKLPNVAEVEIITSNFISSYYFAGLYFLRDEFQLCGQFSFISDESLFIELIAYFICTSARSGIVIVPSLLTNEHAERLPRINHVLVICLPVCLVAYLSRDFFVLVTFLVTLKPINCLHCLQSVFKI